MKRHTWFHSPRQAERVAELGSVTRTVAAQAQRLVSRAVLFALIGTALPAVLVAPVDAGDPVLARGSKLAYPRVQAPLPERVLAQRTIEREWGLPEGEVPVKIPGLRSEGLALALSAAAPGSGHAYVGDGGGWWYGVVEAIGWATHFFFERQARALREDSERIAGQPNDPGSAWSFERWEQASGGDASELRALYLLDREVFYDRIGSDPRYLSGWVGEGAADRMNFTALRDRSNARIQTKRVADIGLLTNHVIAAFDALRAARRHNRPIERELGLRVGPRWRDRQPVMVAALERRF